ncbi:hypothetical protein COO20_22370 [Thalassospira marina]|uniref:Uncharacterized protein n=1 Tax=Thalassospira marina TaxID=2048283 RepID=A0A2N3KG53_9PROT|nr:hypothetical protein COO20_22370 [Thalassospira marina]
MLNLLCFKLMSALSRLLRVTGCALLRSSAMQYAQTDQVSQSTKIAYHLFQIVIIEWVQIRVNYPIRT